MSVGEFALNIFFLLFFYTVMGLLSLLFLYAGIDDSKGFFVVIGIGILLVTVGSIWGVSAEIWGHMNCPSGVIVECGK